jgi:purine-nucleoside phosphorylase
MPDPVDSMTATRTLDTQVREAVAAIRARTSLAPTLGVTLGSGLGGVIDALPDATTFATADLPHWPRSTVVGHAGRLALGAWEGVPVVLLSGRSHRYEGYALAQVTFAVRVMHALGARTMIFTNAVGGVHPDLRPADLLLATDHLNFIGKRGLLTAGEVEMRAHGRRSATYYDPELRAQLADAAARAQVPIRFGTLMGGHGPSYETAAEVRMAAAFGADVVCMSTVHEVTLASELGCRAASISCVTNQATGLSAAPLSHTEVTEVADVGAVKVRALLAEYLRHASVASSRSTRL